MDRKPAGGTYGQGDVSPAAQRNGMRKDQHYTADTQPGEGRPDSYGEGGFPEGGEGHSGYGGDVGTLQSSQRHEKQVTEEQRRSAGTPSKSSR